MTIRTTGGGFEKAEMDARDGSTLVARFYNATAGFEVDWNDDFEGGYYMNEAACREAAEFFTKLADELARRESEPTL